MTIATSINKLVKSKQRQFMNEQGDISRTILISDLEAWAEELSKTHVMMPIEPTDEMIREGVAVEGCFSESEEEIMRREYKAMLSTNKQGGEDKE